MTETRDSNGECRRLLRAVCEGSYVRDPAPWRAHVESCPDCRRMVDGVEVARRLLLDGDADFRPDEKSPPQEGWAVAALREVKRERRRRPWAIVVGWLVAVRQRARALLRRSPAK